MRTLVLRLMAGAAMLLTAWGCTDSPTQPTIAPETLSGASYDVTPQGCVSDGICYLPPISGGPSCDPWMELDWCRDNDCMTSQPGIDDPDFFGIAGCEPGGGGPGGDGPGGPGGGTEPPPSAPDTCATGNPVVDDPAVELGFKDLWAKSGVEKPQAQRLEHAAWIIRNPDGTHRIAPFSYTIQQPCAVNGNMNAPQGAVGWVHTHPFTAGETMQICGALKREVSPGVWTDWIGPDGQPIYPRYGNEPSQPDRDFMHAVNGLRKTLGQNGLDGYMIDSDQIVRYSPYATKDQLYGRCGY